MHNKLILEHKLETLRLYCPIGSAMAPETAGPTMSPTPNAVVVIDSPRA